VVAPQAALRRLNPLSKTSSHPGSLRDFHTVTTATRAEIQQQKDADVSLGGYQDVLQARIAALLPPNSA
jgi:hypothetical protein